jgi:hypothetical protein
VADADAPQLYDFETDEEALEGPASSRPLEPQDDFEALGPAEEEAQYLEGEEPLPEEPAAAADAEVEVEEEVYEADVREPASEPPAPSEPADEPPEEDDILTGSPEFADEGTEGEDLWFEKGPPQDFDFEDEHEDEDEH